MLNGNSVPPLTADLGVTLSGTSQDYCDYYNVGDHNPITEPQLIYQDANQEGGYTGFNVSYPYWYWQEGDRVGNACQAQGTTWGTKVLGNSVNSSCNSPHAPCGMHHYVSNASDGTNDRPWSSSSYGSFPSFVIYAHANPTTVNVSQGAWGYVCPFFEDTSGSLEIIEYCLEEWRAGSGFPSTNTTFDVKAACNSTSGHNVDQVITQFAAGTTFASERPGSAHTFAFNGNPGSRTFIAGISRANLMNAISAVNSGCIRNASTNPDMWAYIGAEHGEEGGGLTALGSSTSSLSFYTTTDTLYAGETLQPGQQLTSSDGKYWAIMQPDGNFVVYNANGPLWSSGTYGYSGAYLVMQPDGNLVMYWPGCGGCWKWQTSTEPSSNDYLIMQPDGNLVVYTNGGQALWSWQTGRLGP